MGKVEGPEVDLRVTRPPIYRHQLRRSPPGRDRGPWHEHLTRLKPLLNIVLHDGVAARETVLVPETVEDPLRRVPLLAVAWSDRLQDLD